MAKLFSVASWNVEHFKKDDPSNVRSARCTRVINYLMGFDPDVFALYEVEGREVFAEIVRKLPDYNFHITEGPQVQEILVGVRHGITSFFTQKIAFKSGVNTLRPGALLTLVIEGVYYPLLFLHAKSAPDPRSFGLRDDIINKSMKFINVLQRASTDNADVNYMIMGDLNTMGMDIKNLNDKDITAKMEIDRIALRADRYYNLELLSKTYPNTWSNGSTSRFVDSNLDHVLAAKHLQFTQFTNNGVTASVSVRGWADTTSVAEKDKWIQDFSDHNLLYFEVDH